MRKTNSAYGISTTTVCLMLFTFVVTSPPQQTSSRTRSPQSTQHPVVDRMPKQQGLVWMAQQAFDPVPSRTQRQQTTTASPALGCAINNIHLIQTCSDQHSRQAVPHVTPSGRTLVGLGGEPLSAFQWMGPTLLPSRPHSVTCPTCRVAREGCQCAVRTQLWPAVSPPEKKFKLFAYYFPSSYSLLTKFANNTASSFYLHIVFRARIVCSNNLKTRCGETEAQII